MQRIRLRTGIVDVERARFERADDETVALTRREADLLAYLAGRAGEDVPRDDLLTHVWGHRADSLSRAVDATVTRLRRKIERDPAAPEVLCTAHGSGYRLVVETSVVALPAAPPAPPVLLLGDCAVDLAAGLVRREGPPIPLTGQERRLLLALAERAGAVVAADRLARAAGIGGRAPLVSAIHRLRAKIEAEPNEPRWLIAVRGEGYRLDAVPQRPTPSLCALQDTLWTVADQVGRLLGLDDCVVYARDGDHLVQMAAFGEKAPERGDLVSPLVLRVGEGIVGAAARDGHAQCVLDVRHDPRYVADLAAMRSELAVPIVRNGAVVGVLDSESPRVAAYEDRHRIAFESLAAIAAAAMADVDRLLR